MSVASCLCGAEFATIRLLLAHSAEAHGRRPGVTYPREECVWCGKDGERGWCGSASKNGACATALERKQRQTHSLILERPV